MNESIREFEQFMLRFAAFLCFVILGEPVHQSLRVNPEITNLFRAIMIALIILTSWGLKKLNSAVLMKLEQYGKSFVPTQPLFAPSVRFRSLKIWAIKNTVFVFSVIAILGFPAIIFLNGIQTPYIVMSSLTALAVEYCLGILVAIVVVESLRFADKRVTQ